jgi:hypothetical protein
MTANSCIRKTFVAGEIQKRQRAQSSLKSAQQLIPVRTSRLFFAALSVKGFLFD